MDIKQLEHIINILKQNDVTDFELEHDGTHIKLSRGSRKPVVQNGAPLHYTSDLEPAIVGQMNGQAISSAPIPAQVPSNMVKVESPIVGTFYRKPGPDTDPFVREGDIVKKGDTLCIVEAMKLMNEIEAKSDGKIEKILVTDGQVVEFGEALFLINPQV